jgi:5-methylcytosine-specific restriction endonuclease McrA
MARLSKSVREEVRRRADRRCEYCRKPQGFSPIDHQVDHIIAVQHGGSDALDNLAFACFRCNNKKGSNIASLDKSVNQLAPLYNPRSQVWSDHFQQESGVITGKTPAGRATAALLDFNEPKQIELRRMLIAAKLWS